MFLVCGEALFDFFVTSNHGPARLSFDARAGGSPFNVAIGLARQGARAGLLTGVSEDMLGLRLVKTLEQEGVETRYLVRSGRRTTLSLVETNDDGAPSYAFYGLGSADCNVTEADLPPLGDDIDALHFGSYSIAVEPVADAFAQLARDNAHRFISLDPNVRPTVLPEREAWRRRVDQLLPQVDLVKVSAEDLDWLYPEASSADIASDWLKSGPKTVVVTDGGASVTAYRPQGSVAVTPPKVDVVDTVGAGDAFQAAMLSELARLEMIGPQFPELSADNLREVLAYASKAAAETCARRGADIPTR